jgi:hypothetical protein
MRRGDDVARAVAAVGAERADVAGRQPVEQLPRAVAFGGAAGQADRVLRDRAASVLHEHMPGMGRDGAGVGLELGLFSLDSHSSEERLER